MKLKFKAYVEGVIPAHKSANVISNPGLNLYIDASTIQTDTAGLLSAVEDDERVVNKLLYRLLDSRLPLTVTIEVE